MDRIRTKVHSFIKPNQHHVVFDKFVMNARFNNKIFTVTSTNTFTFDSIGNHKRNNRYVDFIGAEKVVIIDDIAVAHHSKYKRFSESLYIKSVQYPPHWLQLEFNLPIASTGGTSKKVLNKYSFEIIEKLLQIHSKSINCISVLFIFITLRSYFIYNTKIIHKFYKIEKRYGNSASLSYFSGIYIYIISFRYIGWKRF